MTGLAVIPEQASLAGLICGYIPFNCPIESFHKHFSDKTRMLIVNNPNNPVGKLYSRDELLSLYDQCRSWGIYVMVDEAYSDFVVDGSFTSMASVVPNKDGSYTTLSEKYGYFWLENWLHNFL